MKLSTYAVISAIVTLVYGIALLFFPVQFIENYGSPLDPVGSVVARLYGSAMFSFGIVYWMNRNIPEQDKSWAGLLWASVFFNIANFIVILSGMMNGVGNSLSWSNLVLSVIFCLGSLYFIFRKK